MYNKDLELAILMKKEGKLEESNELLLQLVSKDPNNGLINYYCGCSFDVLGLEASAVPYYEKAIEIGLPEEELKGAYLGLGSTYRTLGQYIKAKGVFEAGLKIFPENKGIQTFYSMVLYNLGDFSKAMEISLKNLAETSTNEDIRKYKKAIEFYSDKLDTIW